MNKEKLLYQRWNIELKIVMTETNKDTAWGIERWKVISGLCKQTHFNILHRYDNLHCSLYSIKSKLWALWCQKEGKQCFWKVNWMCDWGSIVWLGRIIFIEGLCGYCNDSLPESEPNTGRLMNANLCLQWRLVCWHNRREKSRERKIHCLSLY